jgi:2-dehydro-3-deoxyphosphooctonate aldolase (KDO 8-P synthase)
MLIDKVREVKITDTITVGNSEIFLIAGPCVIESEDLVMEVAGKMKEITEKQGIKYVFKASFDKANRTSINSFRGPGLEKGLEILSRVKSKYNLPIATDIHEPWQCKEASKVIDILQIPAFLCRQTDLLIAAAETGKAVNIKKGQFLAPWDMKNVIKKFEEVGNPNIMLCERGTTFGYNNLVVDMRALLEMRKLGYPIVFDATHSVQIPGGQGETTGGNREYVYPLMRSAAAIGIDGIFAEVHPDPDNAMSDGPNMLRLDKIEDVLKSVKKFDDIVKNNI